MSQWKFIIFCILLVVLRNWNVTGQYQQLPSVACPNIFQYVNYDGQIIGRITLDVTPGTTVVDVTLSQQHSVQSDYFGSLSLMESRTQTKDNIFRGEPIHYRVDFPFTNVVPKLTEIAVNQSIICSASPYRAPSTKLMLRNTITTTTYRETNSMNNDIGSLPSWQDESDEQTIPKPRNRELDQEMRATRRPPQADFGYQPPRTKQHSEEIQGTFQSTRRPKSKTQLENSEKQRNESGEKSLRDLVPTSQPKLQSKTQRTRQQESEDAEQSRAREFVPTAQSKLQSKSQRERQDQQEAISDSHRPTRPKLKSQSSNTKTERDQFDEESAKELDRPILNSKSRGVQQKPKQVSIASYDPQEPDEATPDYNTRRRHQQSEQVLETNSQTRPSSKSQQTQKKKQSQSGEIQSQSTTRRTPSRKQPPQSEEGEEQTESESRKSPSPSKSQSTTRRTPSRKQPQQSEEGEEQTESESRKSPSPSKSQSHQPRAHRQTQIANITECGQRKTDAQITTRIIGGSPVERGQYPWLVAIYESNPQSLKFRCGGSLISTRTVISAAHCFDYLGMVKLAENTLVILGRYDLMDWNESSSVTRTVENVTLHPDYNSGREGSFDADIAVIILHQKISFNEMIQPICLWSESNDPQLIEGLDAVVVGWGQDQSGQFTALPSMVHSTVVSDATCLRSRKSFQILTSNRTLCAGKRDGTGPCTGDSGSGLILNRNGRWYLRGSVSASLATSKEKCNLREFVVYCDVAKFMSWIHSIIL